MSSFGARTPHPGAPHVSRDLGSHPERPLRTVFLRDRATNYATLPPPLRKPAMGPQSPPVPQLWARLARFYSHIPSHTLAPNLAQVPILVPLRATLAFGRGSANKIGSFARLLRPTPRGAARPGPTRRCPVLAIRRVPPRGIEMGPARGSRGERVGSKPRLAVSAAHKSEVRDQLELYRNRAVYSRFERGQRRTRAREVILKVLGGVDGTRGVKSPVHKVGTHQ